MRKPVVIHRGMRLCAAAFALVLVGFVALTGLSACGSNTKGGPSVTDQLPSVVIGTLATEDILPLWVAEQEDLFDAIGVEAQIHVFQSATELIAAVSAGEVDYAMTDPMVAASLHASGTDVQMVWVTLGTEASQGRFGIMTSADSGITSLADLAGVGIGVGSNTILEYVMDRLMLGAGVSGDAIVKEELQKLPVRYQEMASGQVKAAALPASLLALGEANGCVLLADDTGGENISQSVMIARSDYLEKEGGEAHLGRMKEVWDEAVALVNANPEEYRSLLVEKANLSGDIAETYPISTYPSCVLPTNAMVDPVLEWMQAKGYLSVDLVYDEATGCFSVR